MAQDIKAPVRNLTPEPERIDLATVARVRADLVQSGQIDHFSERIDPRTGKATQPASKPKPVGVRRPYTSPERIDPTTGEIVGGSTR